MAELPDPRVLEIITPELKSESLYIRSVYPVLYDFILSKREEILAQPSLSQRGLGIAIMGTPRTGKSMFLYYTAQRLRDSGIPFVATIQKSMYDSSFNKIDRATNNDLKNSEVVHLIDPDEQTSTFLEEKSAVAVFFSSTEDNFRPYHFRTLSKRFMPLWTIEELTEAHELLNLPCSYLQESYRKWGGVFLDNVSARELEVHFKELLDSQKLLQLLKVCDPFISSPAVSHNRWMLHMIPLVDSSEFEPYETFTCKLPSNYVRLQIHEKLKAGIVVDIPDCNSLVLGDVFEDLVFKKISETSTLVVTPYDRRFSSPEKTFNVTSHVSFRNKTKIESPTAGTLYKPNEPNKKGGDAVFICESDDAWILQITVSKKHRSLDMSDIKENFPCIPKGHWFVCCIIPSHLMDFVFPPVKALELPNRMKYIAKFELYTLLSVAD